MKQAALLVLDNFEHLVAQPYAAELAAEILQRFANIKILCTSRERLNLHGEWVYELHGLPVPLSSYANSLEDSSAAVLFIACARRVDAKFELAEADKPALVRICHLVEGIPLAIELAAAWVDVLACCEIAREIETNIDFLSTSMRDMPARHRSLRATFDHSWRLLSDAERGVLSRLAVFHGGFDRAAAQAVAGASLPLLSALVSKSLVRRTQDGRYDLHEVIRQYAPSHLHKDQSASFATRDRHCEHFLQLVGRHEKDLNGPAQQAAMRELSRELDNIRTAWVWGIERNQTSLLLASVRGLMWMYMVAGLLAEGIEQLELLIQAFKVERPDEHGVKLLGMALSQQAWLSFRKGENLHSQELYQESLAFLRPTGDPALLMEALIFLGMIAHRNGDYAQAKSLLEEGLACAQAANDTWFAAYAIYNLGAWIFIWATTKKGANRPWLVLICGARSAIHIPLH